jgi:hypothetical protein
MDQEEALDVIVAAADLFGRMLEDERVNQAVAYTRANIAEDVRITNLVALRNLHWTDASDGIEGAPPGNWLLSTIRILDASLHVQAIRVTVRKGMQVAFSKAMQSELELVEALYDDRYETTTIPGFKGDFVIYAHPYGD